MEIEVKFVLPNEHIYRRLVEVAELGGLRLGATEVKHVHDQYVDTAHTAFLRAGFSCRLRAVGDARIVTIKSIEAPDSAVHQREEFEVRLTQAQASGGVEQWPDSEATDFVKLLSEDRPLDVLFHLKQERHVRLATRPGDDRPILEVSVDSVEFGDGITGQVYELEAEVLSAGRLADLESVTVELIEHWAVLPQASSKFERGLALCCPELRSVLGAQKDLPRSLA